MRWRLVALALVSVAATGPGCRRTRLPPRGDGAAAVVVAAPVDGGAESAMPVTTEAEPNDVLANAQRLEIGAERPMAISGTIGAPPKGKDVDLYRLNVAASDAGPGVRQRLSLDARPEGGLAVVVEALDDRGQPLASSLGSAAGEQDGIPNLSVSAGIYFVRIRAGQGGAAQGAYRLTARVSPFETGEEQEPNGKATFATELAVPGEAVGYFGWRRDQDFYKVPLASLAEGTVLLVDLEPPPGCGAGVAVYDSAERKLTEAHGRRDERVALRNVRVPPGEPHLFLEVRTEGGRNLETRYRLQLRTEVPKEGAELEPNDDAAHASALAGGEVAGYLARGDVDVYRYVSAGPAELFIEATPPERVDLKLEVLREPDGAVLARSDMGRRREPERVPNLVVGQGSFLIRLSAAKGDGNPDEPYRMAIGSRPVDPGSEREPNGSAASATELPAGGVGGGLVYPRADADFWRAALPAGTTNTVVNVEGIAGLTLDVRVLSTAEKELARLKVAGATPATQNVIVPGGDGCCLIQVREASGKGTNFRDRYRVSVRP